MVSNEHIEQEGLTRSEVVVRKLQGRRQYATDRHTRLIELLRRRGYCSVSELSAAAQVSPMTIRRDLQDLARQGIVQVSHGGARLALQRQAEPDFEIRAREHLFEKQAIGRQAATFIEPGDVIGIDAGSTAVEVARNLPDIPLTVVTYSLPVVNAVAGNEQCQLVLLGGLFHRESLSFTGPHVIGALRTLRITKLFLATSGLLVPDGLSSTYLFDAEVKRALMESSRQVIVCADSSKFGRGFLAHFASLDSVDTLVTDSGVSSEDRAAVERCNVQVIVAPRT
jgi:DeoR/GlpR family transcriptional regulator of sugar metabolism